MATKKQKVHPAPAPKPRRYAVSFMRPARVEVEATSAVEARDKAILLLTDEAFEIPILSGVERVPLPGTRCRVVSGDGKRDMGRGTLEQMVKVHVARLPDGSITSTKEPETVAPDMQRLPKGSRVEQIDSPRIKLDSGKTIYGCQAWWQPVWEDSNEEPPVLPMPPN